MFRLLSYACALTLALLISENELRMLQRCARMEEKTTSLKGIGHTSNCITQQQQYALYLVVHRY